LFRLDHVQLVRSDKIQEPLSLLLGQAVTDERVDDQEDTRTVQKRQTPSRIHTASAGQVVANAPKRFPCLAVIVPIEECRSLGPAIVDYIPGDEPRRFEDDL